MKNYQNIADGKAAVSRAAMVEHPACKKQKSTIRVNSSTDGCFTVGDVLIVFHWEAKIHVRSKLHYFSLIKDRLNEARHSLFRTTCFGPWLDITYVENDDVMIHYVLQKQCCADDDSFDLPLIYNVNGRNLHFERCEFCLVTGFTFGMVSFRKYRNGDIPFRNWLFPEKIGNDVKIIDVLALIEDEEKFSKVIDEDAIRLCLLLSLEVNFMGRELVSVVDDVLLRMVENLDAWNTFP
nr:phospholipase-like, aminotransferase-like mobile domain protein [Tanacetum cinerariifolium]